MFGHALLGPLDNDLILNYAKTGEPIGPRIVVHGRVIDGTGAVLRDVLIETWQADADGLYPGRGEHRGAADPHFTGFGRHPVDG
ncbi:protocatechuate 3,4-dioxygenase subunit beta, partial [Mycobacterium tuberculosis]|nr:protocatechuate 3,4-dioxygenase subunit beta [Mycobacterium tuberculosis]